MGGQIPGWMMPHTVTVEPYAGDTAYGDLYRPPIAVPCAIDDTQEMVRGADGAEVVSSTGLRTRLRWERTFTLESRVRLRGREMFVVSVSARDTGGMGAGDHLEVRLR